MNLAIVRRICDQALGRLQVHSVGGVLVLVVRSGVTLPARGMFKSDGGFTDPFRAVVNGSHRSWLQPASAAGSFLGDRCRLQATCLVGSSNLAAERRRAEAGRKRTIEAPWKAALVTPWTRHVASVLFSDENELAQDSQAMMLITLARRPESLMLRSYLLGAVRGDATLNRVNTRLETPPDLVDVIREVFVGAEVESFAFQAEARDGQDDREPLEACLGEAAAV